jgi:hypothetical protein
VLTPIELGVLRTEIAMEAWALGWLIKAIGVMVQSAYGILPRHRPGCCESPFIAWRLLDCKRR